MNDVTIICSRHVVIHSDTDMYTRITDLLPHPTTEETNNQARYPRRYFVKSGYIMLSKPEGVKKSAIIDTIAEKMIQKRNKQKSSQR